MSTMTIAYGNKVWHNEAGKRHRTDGPAIERADGSREWWVDGKELTETQFNEVVATVQHKGDDEMKLQYEGQEVECITEGYWPEGVELICSDDGLDWNDSTFVCLQNSIGFTVKGAASSSWKYWAIKTTKPAPRRLTNREVAELVTQERFSVLDGEWVYHYMTYKKEFENEPTPKGIKLRAPGSDEWLEPTSDLLEVGK